MVSPGSSACIHGFLTRDGARCGISAGKLSFAAAKWALGGRRGGFGVCEQDSGMGAHVQLWLSTNWIFLVYQDSHIFHESGTLSTIPGCFKATAVPSQHKSNHARQERLCPFLPVWEAGKGKASSEAK